MLIGKDLWWGESPQYANMQCFSSFFLLDLKKYHFLPSFSHQHWVLKKSMDHLLRLLTHWLVWRDIENMTSISRMHGAHPSKLKSCKTCYISQLLSLWHEFFLNSKTGTTNYGSYVTNIYEKIFRIFCMSLDSLYLSFVCIFNNFSVAERLAATALFCSPSI